jgi:hypothetical protein
VQLPQTPSAWAICFGVRRARTMVVTREPADDELLVAEVRHQFEAAAESRDVVGETLDCGAVGLAVLGLADAGLAHAEADGGTHGGSQPTCSADSSERHRGRPRAGRIYGCRPPGCSSRSSPSQGCAACRRSSATGRLALLSRGAPSCAWRTCRRRSSPRRGSGTCLTLPCIGCTSTTGGSCRTRSCRLRTGPA